MKSIDVIVSEIRKKKKERTKERKKERKNEWTNERTNEQLLLVYPSFSLWILNMSWPAALAAWFRLIQVKVRGKNVLWRIDSEDERCLPGFL